MAEFLLLILLGAAVGTFGALVGAGGGFILVPVLLLVFPEREAGIVTAMSLFVVLLNSMSGSTAYARQRRIDYLSGLMFAAATLPGAVGGAIAVNYIARQVFDLIFAAILGGVGVFLLTRSTPQAIRAPLEGRGVITRHVEDGEGNTFIYSYRLWHGLALSVTIGFFATMLGIGGGVIHVSTMSTLLHFPVHIAVATSQLIVMLMAAQGVTTHFVTGTLTFDENLGQAAFLAIGAVPGAQLGAFIARRLRGGLIMRVLAVTLIVVALRLAWSGITG